MKVTNDCMREQDFYPVIDEIIYKKTGVKFSAWLNSTVKFFIIKSSIPLIYNSSQNYKIYNFCMNLVNFLAIFKLQRLLNS